MERTVLTGRCPNAVAYGEGAAWVVNAGESTVTRIDPADGSMEHFETGHLAGAVMAGFGSVWVTSNHDDSVWRLNAVTGSPQAIVRVGDLPWDVVAGAGAVWVTSHGPEGEAAGTLTRIDPETGQVVTTIDLGYYPNSLAVGTGRDLGGRRRTGPSGRCRGRGGGQPPCAMRAPTSRAISTSASTSSSVVR